MNKIDNILEKAFLDSDVSKWRRVDGCFSDCVEYIHGNIRFQIFWVGSKFFKEYKYQFTIKGDNDRDFLKHKYLYIKNVSETKKDPFIIKTREIIESADKILKEERYEDCMRSIPNDIKYKYNIEDIEEINIEKK